MVQDLLFVFRTAGDADDDHSAASVGECGHIPGELPGRPGASQLVRGCLRIESPCLAYSEQGVRVMSTQRAGALEVHRHSGSIHGTTLSGRRIPKFTFVRGGPLIPLSPG